MAAQIAPLNAPSRIMRWPGSACAAILRDTAMTPRRRMRCVLAAKFRAARAKLHLQPAANDHTGLVAVRVIARFDRFQNETPDRPPWMVASPGWHDPWRHWRSERPSRINNLFILTACAIIYAQIAARCRVSILGVSLLRYARKEMGHDCDHQRKRFCLWWHRVDAP